MSFRRLAFALGVGAALVSSTVAAKTDAPPKLGIASFEQLPQPLPLPYDESADADRVVADGLKRAKASRKLLLIDLGGNWCLDCRLLAGTMDLPQLAPWVRRHFELAMVDIGRFDKNLQIPKHHGMAQLRGVPALLIVDPVTGKVLDNGHEEALADARSLTPQALADWLAQWAK